MQGTALALWIIVSIQLGIFTLGILAYMKWSRYMALQSRRLMKRQMGLQKSDRLSETQNMAFMSSQLTFDKILRDENKLDIAEEEPDDIPAEEFYHAVNLSKAIQDD